MTVDTLDVREYWADTGGCRMRVLEAGEVSRRPPLLLIHGLLGYSFSWRFNLPEFAQDTQVIAVDLPGVGFSERNSNLDCSLRAIAERLNGFLRERGHDAIDLIGTSHGGGLAIMLTALAEREKRPRVRRLVLSAPVNPWSRHGQAVTRLLATRVGASVFRCCEPLLSVTQGWALRRMYGDPERIRPGTLDGYRKPTEIPGTLDHVLRIVKCWHKDLAEIERALPEIAKVPTLLVWGGRDRAVLPESADKLKAHFRNVKLVVFKEAGHLPYEEVPDDFNKVVRDFLASD